MGALKERLQELWAQLPPDHQRALVLELLKEVVESAWPGWMRQLTELGTVPDGDPRYRPFLVATVCRADLEAYFNHEEIANLDDADMARLADKMGDAYLEQGYWADLESSGRRLLAGKEGTGGSPAQQ